MGDYLIIAHSYMEHNGGCETFTFLDGIRLKRVDIYSDGHAKLMILGDISLIVSAEE